MTAVPRFFADDTADGLYRMVLESPSSDEPRLMLADYLNEQLDPPQPERAEFIRVGVELAMLESLRIVNADGEICGWKRKKDRDRSATLQHRSRALLETHGSDWLRSVLRVAGIKAVGNEWIGTDWIYERVGVGGRRRLGFEWSRGFVSTARLTLAAFVGKRCPRCRGYGSVDTDIDPTYFGNCPDCSGTGHLPGLAAALAGACPIESVVLTDREPEHSPALGRISLGWSYTRGDFREFVFDMPPELFDLLTEYRYLGEAKNWKCFPTLAAANAALSRACVAYMRGLA